MPPRSRNPRRSTIKEESATPAPGLDSTPRRNTRRGGRAQSSPPPDLGHEEDAEGSPEEASPEAGPSKRAPARGKAAPRSSTRRGRGKQLEEEEGTLTEDPITDHEETQVEPEEVTATPRKRARKSVSYLEVPVSAVEEAEEQDEDDVPDEEVGGEEDAEGEPEDAEDDESPDKSKRSGRAPRPVFEKVGSGRGGFSVKGAAAAAARARWAKVRREKAERGEESDDDRPRRRPATSSTTLRNKKPDDIPAAGATVLIKGKEYIMGEDELILEDNEKGDTKIDKDGNLLGGREYKFYTYTSEARKDPNRLYALTIDVARSCGYTDSLAFLRRVPRIIKLSCFPSERDLLIEKGKVTGNLKHRMVTMIAVRNLYKLLGARVIKDGKWVVDDYDEEAATIKCQEGGFTPGTIVQDEEVVQHTSAIVRQEYRGEAGARAANLIPFYSLGGPTTQFGGNGANPLYEAGWGNKRAKLKSMGVTEEDWMFKTAEESRRIDAQLKVYREERLLPLEGADLRGWVYTTENLTEGKDTTTEEVLLAVPDIKIDKEDQFGDRAGPSLTPAIKDDEEVLTPLPSVHGNDVEMGDGEAEADQDDQAGRTMAGQIVVETEEVRQRNASKWNWGLGSWKAGVVKASYEPHTHIPHVPLHTQPHSAARNRLSHYPLLASYADSKHQNFVQSTVMGPAARGLASVEYALETRTPKTSTGDGPWDIRIMSPSVEERLSAVKQAEEWEREKRGLKRVVSAV